MEGDEGGEREEVFQERASECGNDSLAPPKTDRSCQEMNLAPEAQPVWYAAQANWQGEWPAVSTTATHTHFKLMSSGQHDSAEMKGEENVEVEAAEELLEMKGGVGTQKGGQKYIKPSHYLIHKSSQMRASAGCEHVKPNLKCNRSNGITLLCYFCPNAGEFTY